MSRLGNVLQEMITNKEETLGASNYIGGNWKIRKVGKIAFLTVVNLTGIPTGSFSLGTIIPAGYRPQAEVSFTLVQRTTTLRVIAVSVTVNGVVNCYNYGSAVSAGVPLNTELIWAIA